MTRGYIDSISDDDFIRLAEASTSLHNLMLRLGYSPNYGKSADKVRARIEKLCLTPPYQVRPVARRTLEDYLVKNGPMINSDKLKKKLLKAGVLVPECYQATCFVKDQWLGQPLSLHLDHVDGDSRNNELSNLRLLCPNCHTQTPTYAGRNAQKQTQSYVLQCSFCHQAFCHRNKSKSRCEDCVGKRHSTPKIEWPDLSTLVKELKLKGYEAYGKELGIASSAIRNHLRRRGLNPQDFNTRAYKSRGRR